ncbi:MAG: hypothetical protein IJC35_03655 [Oscillospiraceae bacterium]|nr:hypothetical protein [Oscillospiraceae bacterium]
MAQEIPVYLFTGFLDSGKTKFIQETFEDERFNSGENTLLLVCEEGEEEYDPSLFVHNCVYIQVIHAPEELTPQYLEKLRKEHKCQRVVVEYNGMWLLNDFYNNMPPKWVVAQEFFFADANTILTYNANMRNLVGDKLASCELVVFNRFKEGTDEMPYHQLVRNFTPRADIAYEAPDGSVRYDDIVDPLPFDVDAPVIEIGERAFAQWYRDLSERMEIYGGKTVSLKGLAVDKRGLKNTEFIFGRNIMTCCVDDMQFAGLVGVVSGKPRPKNKSWVQITADISLMYHDVYGRMGPILKIREIAPCEAPEQEVATFY